MNKIKNKEAIKYAKQKYKEEYGKRPYNAMITIMKRYGGGNYVLIIGNRLSTEYYF